MYVAAREGRDYTVKCLVKKGADISIKDKDGVRETILLMVVYWPILLIFHVMVYEEDRQTIGLLCIRYSISNQYCMVIPTVYLTPPVLSVCPTVNNDIQF